MDPPEEPILRVNRKQTALVLGGSAAAAFPPDLLISEPISIAPLQRDTIKALGCILTPPLCPSVLSSKFSVSVLLHGLAGLSSTLFIGFCYLHPLILVNAHPEKSPHRKCCLFINVSL